MSFQSAFFQLAKLTCRKAPSGSGLIPFPGFPFGVSITVYLVAFQEPMRPLKFLTLLCRHARRSDPDRPSGISPRGYLRSTFVFSVRCLVSRQCHTISIIISATDSSAWASVSLTTWPPVWMLLTRLKSLQEGATSLWPIGFSVYASRLLFANHAGYNPRHDRSASRARLDTGGWLVLTRQGLSPCKKRQASLDALTNKRLSVVRTAPNSGGGLGFGAHDG